jgi:Protein of unknown function (DUF3341)
VKKRMLLTEFGSPEDLALAARHLRARGQRKLDAYTPYSTDAVREALDLGQSPLSRLVFVGALLGAGGAYLLEWYTTAHLYPLNVGGRPPHMPLPFVPIAFEMGVLLAAFTAFFGVLVGGRLLKLWDPVFEVEGFESVSVDRFWLRVDESDAAFDPAHLQQELAPFNPRRHVVLGGSA